MSMSVDRPEQDCLHVEIVPDVNDEAGWVFLAHLSSHLWTNYGVDLDCDKIVVTLVYAAEYEDGA